MRVSTACLLAAVFASTAAAQQRGAIRKSSVSVSPVKPETTFAAPGKLGLEATFEVEADDFTSPGSDRPLAVACEAIIQKEIAGLWEFFAIEEVPIAGKAPKVNQKRAFHTFSKQISDMPPGAYRVIYILYSTKRAPGLKEVDEFGTLWIRHTAMVESSAVYNVE